MDPSTQPNVNWRGATPEQIRFAQSAAAYLVAAAKKMHDEQKAKGSSTTKPRPTAKQKPN